MTLRYREFPPPSGLAPFVKCLWLMEGEGPRARAGAEPILPDGSPELILHLGDPFLAAVGDEPATRQPRAHFTGQLTRRLLLQPSGQMAVLGVRFRPAGAAGFVADSQDRLCDRWIELEQLHGGRGRAVTEAAGNAATREEAMATVSRWLAGILGPGGDRRVARAADRVLQSGGRLSIDRLAQDAGVGPRHLERGFLRDVGISPKRLSRIARFQQVFRGIERHPARWAAIAMDHGYYDSSHLVRDFRALSGRSPGRLIEEAGPLTRCFTSGIPWQLESDSSNPA